MPRAKKSAKTRPSAKAAGENKIDTKGLWVPDKNLEFARSVLQDEKRNQERVDKANADAAKAAEMGLGVSMADRVNAAAFEQAQAELK